MGSELTPFARELFITSLILQRLIEEEGIESLEVRAFVQDFANRVAPLLAAPERAKLKIAVAEKLLTM